MVIAIKRYIQNFLSFVFLHKGLQASHQNCKFFVFNLQLTKNSPQFLIDCLTICCYN